jgi:acyl-CoA hydrolase
MGLISNGTTIFDNGSMASGFGGSLNFISKATASASASIEFTSGIDSTYKEYVFYFVNMHPSTDGVKISI